MYEEWRASPGARSIFAPVARARCRAHGRRAMLRDDAPLAEIRRAITARAPGAQLEADAGDRPCDRGNECRVKLPTVVLLVLLVVVALFTALQLERFHHAHAAQSGRDHCPGAARRAHAGLHRRDRRGVPDLHRLSADQLPRSKRGALAKELKSQRELADRAEASRFTGAAHLSRPRAGVIAHPQRRFRRQARFPSRRRQSRRFGPISSTPATRWPHTSESSRTGWSLRSADRAGSDRR